MKVSYAPRMIEAIERGRLRRDWRAIAKRVEAREGHWQLIEVTERTDRGVAAEITEKLRAVGCRAQVVALLGIGKSPRPWTGFAVYARIPRSRRSPDGKLF